MCHRWERVPSREVRSSVSEEMRAAGVAESGKLSATGLSARVIPSRPQYSGRLAESPLAGPAP